MENDNDVMAESVNIEGTTVQSVDKIDGVIHCFPESIYIPY
jgi:hypothetical protein